MRRADFALVIVIIVLRSGVGGGGGVVQGHVGFYSFGIAAGGGLPAGFFGVGVEVVGEVFGVGVADFPGGGEAGFLGGGLDGGLVGVGLEEERRYAGREIFGGLLPFWLRACR